MKLVTVHLWKEWREHRGLCIAIAIAFPAMALLFELFAPSNLGGRGAMPGVVALLAFATVSLAFFGDVFASEERRGTIAFLRRQPGGWWPPFAAKFLFLASATLAITSWSWGSAAGITWSCHHVAPDAIESNRIEAIVELLVLVPLWSVVVSIWFPRSTIALPAAAFVLTLFLAPIVAACSWGRGAAEPGIRFGELLTSTLRVLRLSDSLLLTGLRTLVVAAPIIAGLSYAYGRSIERGKWRAALIGLVASLVLFTPAYAWTAGRVADFRRFDAHSSTLHISIAGCVSTNGRFAYANSWNGDDGEESSFASAPDHESRPSHALQIDLANGSWREIARVGARIWPEPRALVHGSASRLILEDRAAVVRPMEWSSSVETSLEKGFDRPVIDADSGEVVASDQERATRASSLGGGTRNRTSANAIVLPDGSHAWIEHGHVVRSDPDGAVRVLPDSEVVPGAAIVAMGWSAGHGFLLGARNYYDVLRERRFVVPDAPESQFVRWIRAGECIVIPNTSSTKSTRVGPCSWSRWNSSTGEVSPIAGFAGDGRAAESIDEMADDGRLIVATFGTPRNQAPPARLWLLDPDTGTRESVPLPAAVGDWKTVHVFTQARTNSGMPVMALFDAQFNHAVFARFDLSARRFDMADVGMASRVELVGCDSEDSIVVTDGRRLLRAWFGRPGVEVVFPKSDG
jgi:hypothetical protein